MGLAGFSIRVCKLIRECRNKLQVSKAELVNVLEDSMEELDVMTDEKQEEIELEFRAFEVKTVRLSLM